MFRSKSSRETMRQMAKRTEKERLDKLKKKEKNRKRPNTIAFRMSDEERRLFEDRVVMSGLLKQDFIIQSLLFSNVQFFGMPLFFCDSHKVVEFILIKRVCSER